MFLLDELQRKLQEYQIQAITKEDFEQVMPAYRTNEAFFLLTDGKPAEKEQCLHDIDEVPPNFSLENKYFLGLWKDGDIAAVLDFLVGFPEPGIIWIGLLLIHGKLQGTGIGTEIINRLCEVCKEQGYAAVQIGVIEENKKALQFWGKQGFKEIRKTTITREDKPDWYVVVMEKPLEKPASQPESQDQ